MCVVLLSCVSFQCESWSAPVRRGNLPPLSEDSVQEGEAKEEAGEGEEEEEEGEFSLSKASAGLLKQVR